MAKAPKQDAPRKPIGYTIWHHPTARVMYAKKSDAIAEALRLVEDVYAKDQSRDVVIHAVVPALTVFSQRNTGISDYSGNED